MISKRKIAAMILFLLMSLFMFTFANPAGNPEENLIPEEEINEEEPAPVIPEPETPPVDEEDDEEIVLDTTAPIIIINGGDVIIRVGGTYIDEGATVTDETDEDISLVTSTNINTSTRGAYTVTYSATDASGNEAIPQVRTVYVVDVSDLEAAIEEGNNVLDDTNGQEVSDELADLLNQLEDALLEGEDVILDLLSEQPIVDDATDEINDLLDQIYNLNFEVRFIDFNDELIESVTVKYKQTAVAPANPIRVGYTFINWDSEYTNIMNNKTVKAVYTANTNTPYVYEVYLEDLEGNFDLSSVYEINGTTDTNAIITPEVFTGFILNNALSVLNGNISADGSLVLKAYYNREIYTLTYVIDGEMLENNIQEYKFESPVTPLDAPLKIGHTFNGWVGIPMSVTEDVTITGSFSINSYDVVFNINGNEFETLSFEYGAQIVAPEYAAISGYTFSGWGTLPVMGLETLTFNATLTANKNTVYMIDYYFENLDGMYVHDRTTSHTGTTNTLASVLPDAVNGFNINESMSILSGNIAGNGSLALKVYYSREIYTIRYEVDEIFFDEQTYKFESSVSELTKPTKTGYTFNGWFGVPTSVTANATVTGNFSINSYDVVFNINSVEHSTVSFEYGAQIVAPAFIVPDGYTFSGWGILPEMGVTPLTFNATLTANNDTNYVVEYYLENLDGTYEIDVQNFIGTTDTIADAVVSAPIGFVLNNVDSILSGNINGDGSLVLEVYYDREVYTVTYKIDDVIVGDIDSYKFGEPTELRAVPTQLGYTFSGWSDLPVTLTENVIVTGNFSINSYDAVFNINESEYETISFEYGAQIVAPEYIVPDGYTFSGWGILPEMGSSNVEFNATLTLNEVNLISLTATLVPINYLVGDAMGSLNVIAYYDNGTSMVLSSSEYFITRSFNSSAVTEVSDYVEVSYEGLTARAYYDVYANASSGFIRLTRQSGGIFVEYWPHSNSVKEVYYIYSSTPLSGSEIETIVNDPNGDKEELVMTRVGTKYYTSSITTNEPGYHYVWATDASTHTLGYELIIINE
jgi:uncharacterized repeat protein (TIGR02543 family)